MHAWHIMHAQNKLCYHFGKETDLATMASGLFGLVGVAITIATSVLALPTVVPWPQSYTVGDGTVLTLSDPFVFEGVGESSPTLTSALARFGGLQLFCAFASL